MYETWDLAGKRITRAQRHQKEQHDRSARPVKFTTGKRVFLKMPMSLGLQMVIGLYLRMISWNLLELVKLIL